MPRKRRKKKRTQPQEALVAEAEDQKAPKSFVIRRGKVGNRVISLVHNVREVMMPNTAADLKEHKKNKLRDFINVAPTLNVTHMMVFSKSVLGLNMRLMRVPRGPTLTFRVLKYSLKQDIAAMQKKPHTPTDRDILDPPLLVLNNFVGEGAGSKLTATALQSMFPPLDVEAIKLKSCRRVLLVNKNKLDGTIDMRHYLIKAAPTGISKSIKKIVRAKIPNLGKLMDISEFVERDGMVSDSEAEDNPDHTMNLPQDFSGRGNRKANRSAIRLKEIGPRLTLQLLKIEEGISSGATLYHAFETRTPAEAAKLRELKRKEAELKRLRRLQQERNVEKKRKEKEELAKKSRAQAKMKEVEVVEAPTFDGEDEEEKNDADYYREEVGEEPPEELFETNKGKNTNARGNKKKKKKKKRPNSNEENNSNRKKIMPGRKKRKKK
mmetsp:Transcript_8830/g.21736  ORF Transcript_8830/g.21736 Transcript_8830/m.21736 type:complete len:436 (-) Transcript_8830:339-1646(-)